MKLLISQFFLNTFPIVFLQRNNIYFYNDLYFKLNNYLILINIRNLSSFLVLWLTVTMQRLHWVNVSKTPQNQPRTLFLLDPTIDYRLPVISIRQPHLFEYICCYCYFFCLFSLFIHSLALFLCRHSVYLMAF